MEDINNEFNEISKELYKESELSTELVDESADINKNKMEYIICSAIWFDNFKKHVHQPRNIESGFVIAGMRHHNCYATMGILSDDVGKYHMCEKEQGFLTNLDRFVNREEAAEIAYNAGQIKEVTRSLYSEDLY